MANARGTFETKARTKYDRSEAFGRYEDRNYEYITGFSTNKCYVYGPLRESIFSFHRSCCYNMAESETGTELFCPDKDKEKEGMKFINRPPRIVEPSRFFLLLFMDYFS